MTRLSHHRALTLYALVLVLVFVAFVLGLLIGTGSVQQEELLPAESSYEPAKDLETQLEFYDELSKPIDESKNKDPVVALEKDPKPRAEPKVIVERRTAPVQRDGDDAFTIQVAAHSTKEEAQQLLIRLRNKSFEGRIREPETSGDKYFRVWVGEFSSADEAEEYTARLKAEGFHTYIRRIQ